MDGGIPKHVCFPAKAKVTNAYLSMYVSRSHHSSLISLSHPTNRPMQPASQKQTQSKRQQVLPLSYLFQSVPTPSLCSNPFLSASITSSLCFFSAFNSSSFGPIINPFKNLFSCSNSLILLSSFSSACFFSRACCSSVCSLCFFFARNRALAAVFLNLFKSASGSPSEVGY